MMAKQSTPGHPQVGAVILAAGIARRAGVTKQLLDLNGKPLLQYVIDNVLASSADVVLVVLGHDAKAIEAAIETGEVEIVLNSDYATGQAGSLIAGLQALPARCDAAVVLLGDQPGVDAAAIDRVIAHWTENQAPIVVSVWQGQRGNPVLISRSLFAEIATLTGDTGARAIFARHADEIEAVEFDRPMPLDVDTLADYRVLTQET